MGYDDVRGFDKSLLELVVGLLEDAALVGFTAVGVLYKTGS
jgi:hypothetical protein